MQRALDKMIRRYGNAAVLVQDGQRNYIRAFLQETRSKSQENAQRDYSPLGEVCKSLFVYIGPASPMAAAGDRLEYQQRYFEVRRSAPVMVGNKILCCWGLCVERGADT